MDFQRIFLVLIFVFSGALLWSTYNHPQIANDQATKNQPNPVAALVQKPAVTVPQSATPFAATDAQNKITVKTDTLLIEINKVGGDIQRVELLRHKSVEDQSKPFVLLQNQPSLTYLTQSGLLGENLPDHHSIYSTESNEYQLAEKNESVTVTLKTSGNIQKVYVFHRDSYLIDVRYEIENQSAKAINASAYFQLVRDDSLPSGDSKMVPTYTGPAIYTDQEKFQKIDFASIEKNKTSYPKTADNGWIAILQHYFVTAWIPSKQTREYYTKPLGNKQFAIGTVLPFEAIPAGQKGVVKTQLYVGPASAKLNDVAPGLGLTVDYGWLTIIATPLFWMLTFIQSWVSNWGFAIIALTVLIKLIFFPLSAASYKSMAKMRVVAPKLEKIKQQYGEDREKLNRAMMDLYKTEKINPLGGCLPVLIQIPVFISLYWAILSSVELRNAPFIGWINDLSAADPYFVLPAIMGISMFIQGRLNPKPPDPLQAKLMQLMPMVFSAVFFFFPAGLVLYSIVNNVLSILQQWYITRSQEREYSVVAKR